MWLDPAAVELDVTTFTGMAGAETPEAMEQAALLYRGDFWRDSVLTRSHSRRG